jgi:GntR family transcriptional regulator / MocR family aminotransferase
LDRHVFKTKRINRGKRRCLIEALGRAFGERIRIVGEDAALHLLLELASHRFRQADLARFAERGVKVDWVEDCACRKGFHRNQLVLGYGGLEPRQIEAGVLRLKAAIEDL